MLQLIPKASIRRTSMSKTIAPVRRLKSAEL